MVSNGEVVGLKGRERLESIVVRRPDESSVELPADLVLVSIGQVPDLSGFEHWGLGLSGTKIDVDSAMETSLPGVYAVGDFAAYPGKVRMIATAVAEGSTAPPPRSATCRRTEAPAAPRARRPGGRRVAPALIRDLRVRPSHPSLRRRP